MSFLQRVIVSAIIAIVTTLIVDVAGFEFSSGFSFVVPVCYFCLVYFLLSLLLPERSKK